MKAGQVGFLMGCVPFSTQVMYSQEGQNLSVKGHDNSLGLDKITISLRPSLGI